MSDPAAPDAPVPGVRFVTPPEEVPERARRFLEAFAAILKHSNYAFTLDHFAGMGTECGRCTAYCHVYQASGRLGDAPCYRSELLLRTYRRHFSASGWLQARLMGSAPLSDAEVDEMAREFYRCNACSRCSLHCPMGVDHGFVTHLGRYILSEMGIYPAGFRLETPPPTPDLAYEAVNAAHDQVDRLGRELLERLGTATPLPFEQPDREYLFFPASLEDPFERETILGQIAVLNATGASWTLSTRSIEPLGHGLHCNDRALEAGVATMILEAHRLNARSILVGESGHTYRAARVVSRALGGDRPLPVVSTIELTARALASGAIKPTRTVEGRVTYHDPCNLARWNWVVEPPRQVIRALAGDFVELKDHGRNGICCGGGGGAAGLPELKEFRTRVAGKLKADQVRASGARTVVTTCACCRTQFRDLFPARDIDVEVVSLHELVLRSMAGAPAVRRAEGTFDQDGRPAPTGTC